MLYYVNGNDYFYRRQKLLWLWFWGRSMFSSGQFVADNNYNQMMNNLGRDHIM